MASRLLARIDAQIAQARTPVDAACLRAQRAGVLARQGNLALARKAIDQLQAQFEWRPHAAVSAWISFAEGLYEHYGYLGAAARDRFQRAFALSGAVHLAPLRALSAAWLAHLYFTQHDMLQMSQHVVLALQAAAADNHAALARANLVVAQGYHYGGRPDLALPWYTRSRGHAMADGDEAAVSAIMHNQAELRGHQARLEAMFGEASGSVARQALMGAQSTENYDAVTGIGSLGSLVPMLRAQLLVADGHFAEALALYDDRFDAAMADGLERQKPCFLADIAWCRLQLGNSAGARESMRAAESSLQHPCDIDDRALAHGRLAQVCSSLGLDDAAAQMRVRAERDLAVHRAEQARLVALLDDALAALKEMPGRPKVP
jgi:tetratricopeptide (TPR) repeat protein